MLAALSILSTKGLWILLSGMLGDCRVLPSIIMLGFLLLQFAVGTISFMHLSE